MILSVCTCSIWGWVAIAGNDHFVNAGGSLPNWCAGRFVENASGMGPECRVAASGKWKIIGEVEDYKRGVRSFQSGLEPSINAIFQALCQFLICHSRCRAEMIVSYSST